MTLIGKLATVFPLMHFCMIAAAFVLVVNHPNILSVLIFLAAIYLLGPLSFRLYSLLFPPRSGRWSLSAPERNDWWVAHQMQMIYAAVPVFEALLRLVPGMYSAWLRLWGSKVGKRVYWTPLVEIVDRHMLRVGDDVIFGHRVVCASHVIVKKQNGDFFLILRTTRIGSGTFVGAFARIGPGVKIPDATIVPYNAEHRFSYAE
jgi:hypothetical protein